LASGKKTCSTGLTEAQARTLADWWGGRYQQLTAPESGGEACHGVILQASAPCGPAHATPLEAIIFSLEEARALEKLRGVNNPGAPDWVG